MDKINIDDIREEDGTLTTESLGGLIIDALIDAKIIKQEDFDRALEIAAEEINVRKAIGDY